MVYAILFLFLQKNLTTMSYCKNCGQQLNPSLNCCPSCGAPVNIIDDPVPASEPLENNNYAGNQVCKCQDGKYRWMYEMHLIKNPTIFLTVFKIFAYIILIGFLVFGFFRYAIHGDWAGLWGMAKAMVIAFAGMTVLTFLGVCLVAMMYGGKYIVLFEMDDKGIAHIQLPQQYKKAQVMGLIAALAGLATGTPSAAGAGLLAATRNKSVTNFTKVRSIKANRKWNVIKVNQRLFKNQVYVPDSDFDFVYEFINSHCPNVK